MPREIDVVDPRLGPNSTQGVGWVRAPFNHAIIFPGGTGASAFVTAYSPGFKRVLESAKFYVGVAGAGAGASRVLEIVKNGAIVVATVTLTLAGTATPGTEIDIPVTAANAEFLDADTLTIDFAAGGTAFTGGSGGIVLNFRTRPQQLT